METRHLNKTVTATGFCASLCALCLALMFVADVSFVYFANASYYFALGFSYEFTIAAVALVAGIAGFRYFYQHR
jgi:hypothetical protein